MREAGEAAAQRAPASAARWFAAALRLPPDDASAEERVELLLARSGALAGAGQFADSHATLLESMKIVPADADALRVRLTAACAGMERLLGRQSEAHARLETAVAELPDAGSLEAVALTIELAADSLLRGDYAGMRPWAERAVEKARPLGDPALSAAALAMRALAASYAGDTTDARSLASDAAKLIDDLSDDELARRLDALVHLATAETYLDRFEASGRHAGRALAIGRATGQGDLFPLIFPMLGTALWVQGRLAEAAVVFDGAVESARLLGNVNTLAWNLFNRSFAAIAAGDVETALATAEESVELAKGLDESIVASHVLFETGEAAPAADLLLTATVGEELRQIPGGWRAYGLELLTRCLLQSGRRDEAARAAAAAEACADAVGLPMAAAIAARAGAAVDLDAGGGTAAAERALASAVALEEVGALYDAAVSRALAGRALALAGENNRAAAGLEWAAAAFASFGADRYRAEVERELRKLGRHIHHRTRPGKSDGIGVGSLTARELEVARLIVDRKTNPEFAAALFLSGKTVETHIRNMFRKLRVSSRVELARAVERADRSEAVS